MIADPPSALALLLKRLVARSERKEDRNPLNGGVLRVEMERPALPKPRTPPDVESALKALPPPAPPRIDVLSLPDRDHLRVVVPDPDFVDYDTPKDAVRMDGSRRR